MKYDLVIFDIDGTLCPSGRVLNEDELKIMDTTNPKDFKISNFGLGMQYTHFPGVRKVLEEIAKTAKLGIASNGPSFRQKNKLIAAGIDYFFDKEVIMISEDLALFYHSLDTGLKYWPNEYVRGEYLKMVEKPNSDLLGHILLRTNVSKQRTVYVGNTKEDLQAAQKIGLDFIRIIDKEKEDFKSENEIHQFEFSKLIDLLS